MHKIQPSQIRLMLALRCQSTPLLLKVSFGTFLVRAEIIPLAITPVRDAAPNEMLTGKPMNVVNVAALDIPVAMLIPLK